MATFFSLITELESLLVQLNNILSGGDDVTVEVNGVTKDSISKSIKDTFSSIQAMVQGRQTFKTKLDMESNLNFSEDTLAEVWDDLDPDNNGLYGKLGESGSGSWKRSAYDTLISVPKASFLEQYIKFVQKSVSSSIGNDSYSKDFSWAVIDSEKRVAIGVNENGEVDLIPTADLKDSITKDIFDLPGVETEYVWGVKGDDDRIAIGITRSGKVKLIRDNETFNSNPFSDSFVWGITDQRGKVGLGLKESGHLFAKLCNQSIQYISEELAKLNDLYTFVDNRYENKDNVYVYNAFYETTISQPKDKVIDMIIHAGQSLSVGGGAVYYKDNDIPDQATVSKLEGVSEFCLMFNTGTRSTETQPVNTQEITHFTGIKEVFDGARVGETQGSGMLSKLHSLLSGEKNLNHTWLYRTHGAGGRSYDQIKKGTVPYQNCMDEISRAREICQLYGWSLRVKALFVTHGEADTNINNLNYDQDLSQFINDYRSDIPLITNQSDDIVVLIDQKPCPRNGDGHKVMNDQLSVSLAIEKCFLTQPKYQYDFVDSVHLTAKGYRLLGEKQGAVLKAVLSGEDWKPLYPEDISINGKVITIVFNVPVGPLIFDIDLLPEVQNYGFHYKDDENSASIALVEIKNQNTVEITLDALPTGANRFISYAYDYPTGNLRDSDLTTANFDGTKLPNWAVAFEKSI
ncbi:MAG TPA: hypothetical protein DCS78_12440 [Pseudoalteromonas shioyasakiensis]|nr:hypothetical protein [Pseudoalteromonas shioyasakiensis]|tara:strand:+ start:186 stop:2246 length:2061 start_codon:yes stop_codon:yes gene_type:complete